MNAGHAGGEVLIDPRLRARRHEVRHRQRRRRRRRLTGVAGIAATAVAAGAAAWSPLLDVDRVVVRGAGSHGTEALLAAAGIAPGHPMATLELGRARRALEAVAWVGSAQVQRTWPGTVVVEVTVRRPVAAVRSGEDRWVLVDADGRQLAVVAGDEIADLPRVEGLAVEPSPGEMLGGGAGGVLELTGRLGTALPDAGVGVTVAGDGTLEVLVQRPDGVERRARFGRPDQLGDKVVALVSVLDQLDQALPKAVIDVRVPGSPVLTEGKY